MLKITPKITELLFDLSQIEIEENTCFLNGDLSELSNNLLKLYCVTDNQNSREKIIAIMSEAGYPWLSKSNGCVLKGTAIEQRQAVIAENLFMSEDDFLNMLPANSYFH